MTEADLKILAARLKPYVPDGTQNLCASWLVRYHIHLRISRPRKTKLGDFRPAHNGHPHRISVNSDLQPLQFLITFSHEVAHVENWQKHQRSVSPHGPEWKALYREKLHHILELQVLDQQTAESLYQHSLNPRASSTADASLKAINGLEKTENTLNALMPGSVFEIENGKVFRALKKLRKYWLCEELTSQRHYRVLGTLPVTAHNIRQETGTTETD